MTKITISIVIEQEGHPLRTFASTTPPCFNAISQPAVFEATCKVAETVLGSIHKRYCPNPGEEEASADGKE